MSRHIIAITVIAASLATPVASAQAGFFTDVARGAVSNAARHAKQSAKDSIALGRLLGRCVINRATGRQC